MLRRMEDAEAARVIETGQPMAYGIVHARDDAAAAGHERNEICANCGAARVGPYCHACGQAGHVHRNLGALIHDLAHGVFHFEGKIWRTVPLLAWRPGELTRRYVQGERTRFVSPIALFLFSVFLLFAIMPSTVGHSGDFIRSDMPTPAEVSAEQAKLNALQAERARATDRGAIEELDGRIRAQKIALGVLTRVVRAEPGGPPQARPVRTDISWPWLRAAIEHAEHNPDLLIYKLKSYAYKYSWALVPISLPFIWLLFAFRRDVGLYDHAIFAIYSLSFMSLGVIVLVLLGRIGVPDGLLGAAALLVPPVHMYRQLKGAYRLGRLGAAWRTLALLVTTGIAAILFAAFVVYLGAD